MKCLILSSIQILKLGLETVTARVKVAKQSLGENQVVTPWRRDEINVPGDCIGSFTFRVVKFDEPNA